MKTIENSILVNAPVAQIYEQWLRFEDLPRFIKCLGEVKRIDDNHFSFSVSRDGDEQRGLIEVLRHIRQRRIAWRTVSDNVGLGVVTFEPRSERTTEIFLKLRSVFEASISSESAEQYLIDFKKLIEV
jgi:uncharacterized membrane protein